MYLVICLKCFLPLLITAVVVPPTPHLSEFGKSPPSPFVLFVVAVCMFVLPFLSAIGFGWSKKDSISEEREGGITQPIGPRVETAVS